jgi:hypothetical protein
MVSDSTDRNEFAAELAANSSQVRVHAWSNIATEPGFSISCAENHMKNDVTEGLGHLPMMNKTRTEVNRAFSAGRIFE